MASFVNYNLTAALMVVIGLAIALELSVYAFWRSRLYSLYLDYYNKITHPLVPEAWRTQSGGYNIDFFIEWKMFWSALNPNMGPELIRLIKRQRLIVIFYYLPLLAFVLLAFGGEIWRGMGYGINLVGSVVTHALSGPYVR